MKVLLIEPARKCVSAVTGVLRIAIGKADAAGPLDAVHPHQRDAGAGHAGVVQHLLHGGLELLDRLRMQGRLSGGCVSAAEHADATERQRHNQSHAE